MAFASCCNIVNFQFQQASLCIFLSVPLFQKSSIWSQSPFSESEHGEGEQGGSKYKCLAMCGRNVSSWN